MKLKTILTALPLILALLTLSGKSYAYTRQFGNPDAKITIIEYADYECPYCRTYELKVLPRLIKTFKRKVLFVFRDLPLTNIHKYALRASEVAGCAYYQGRYFKVRYLLYKYQSAWTKNGNFGSVLGRYIDDNRLVRCLASGKEKSMIKSDVEYDIRHNLYETPTFQIYKNGRLVQTILGAQSYKFMESIIYKLLKGE